MGAFEILNVKRYCCRMRISNPSVMASTYTVELDSMINIGDTSLPPDMVISSIKEKQLNDVSLRYVTESLLNAQQVKPEAKVVELREKIEQKDKVSEISDFETVFDSEGNPLGSTPKLIPKSEEEREDTFNKREKIGDNSSKFVFRPNEIDKTTVVSIVDVGCGYEVPKIKRVICVDETEKIPPRLKQNLDNLKKLKNEADIVKWLKRFTKGYLLDIPKVSIDKTDKKLFTPLVEKKQNLGISGGVIWAFNNPSLFGKFYEKYYERNPDKKSVDFYFTFVPSYNTKKKNTEKISIDYRPVQNSDELPPDMLDIISGFEN